MTLCLKPWDRNLSLRYAHMYPRNSKVQVWMIFTVYRQWISECTALYRYCRNAHGLFFGLLHQCIWSFKAVNETMLFLALCTECMLYALFCLFVFYCLSILRSLVLITSTTQTLSMRWLQSQGQWDPQAWKLRNLWLTWPVNGVSISCLQWHCIPGLCQQNRVQNNDSCWPRCHLVRELSSNSDVVGDMAEGLTSSKYAIVVVWHLWFQGDARLVVSVTVLATSPSQGTGDSSPSGLWSN